MIPLNCIIFGIIRENREGILFTKVHLFLFTFFADVIQLGNFYFFCLSDVLQRHRSESHNQTGRLARKLDLALNIRILDLKLPITLQINLTNKE